ncbi:hypothetical protein GLAREA_03158 [Glarea lozoyensis ATCC 20868]|uniref:Uncharacterized protein n=1 Tax=Glarea lozoyensis (strain ATCC 20868 / MF5171) TaxID=1116229 RepID=S3DL12_GLAL2|nr:uncharacterized protein GLAREA_03158 [Glarea lozoyensis ATCC 20868]EPE27243.1 hypothetical protein GLAREA_03158 [Glarea lozoyensis ATCC 20868]
MNEVLKRRGIAPPARIKTSFQAEAQDKKCAHTRSTSRNPPVMDSSSGDEDEDEIDFDNLYFLESELQESKAERLARWKAFYAADEYDRYKWRLVNDEKEERLSDKIFNKLLATTSSDPIDISSARPQSELRVRAWWGRIRKELHIEDEEIGYPGWNGEFGDNFHDKNFVGDDEAPQRFRHGNKRFTRWMKPVEVEEIQWTNALSKTW